MNDSLVTSAPGRAAISLREGNVLKAYQDSVGIWTIGVGHTAAAGDPKPVKGMSITASQSDEILSRDLKTFEKGVRDAVKIALNQNEFDALVSFAFNVGVGAFSKSTLAKKLNAGDRAGAADQFLVWNKAGGKVLEGLTTRRQDERKQFLTLAAAIPPQLSPGLANPPPTAAVETAPAPSGNWLSALISIIANIFKRKPA